MLASNREINEKEDAESERSVGQCNSESSDDICYIDDGKGFQLESEDSHDSDNFELGKENQISE